jgi:S1-C subfamily serine protease
MSRQIGFVVLAATMIAGCVVAPGMGASTLPAERSELRVVTDLSTMKGCKDLGAATARSEGRADRAKTESAKQLREVGRARNATHLRFFEFRKTSDVDASYQQSAHYFGCEREDVAAAGSSTAPQAPRAGADDGAAIAIGTCFFATDTGLAVTNRHVVANSLTIKIVLNDGTEHEASLLRQQSNSDLALLQVRDPIKTAFLLPSDQPVKLGEQVFTIGFPLSDALGNDPKFVEGAIAGMRVAEDDRILQTAMIVHPGNSGGALVKLDGSLAGVVFAKANQLTFLKTSGSLAEGISFAVKAPLVQRLLGADAPKVPFVARDRTDAIDNAVRATCRVISTRDGQDFSK